MAVITFLIPVSDPWNTGKALTWLSGSAYGRTAIQVAPVAIALILTVPLLVWGRLELDLPSLDENTPLVLGVRHTRRLPREAIAGAALVSIADTLSRIGSRRHRCVPAGRVTALIGIPYSHGHSGGCDD